VRSLERQLPPGRLSLSPTEGGLYLWCRLPDPDLDSARLQEEAARAGVSLVAGGPFYADGRGEHHVRLCHAGTPPADTDRGVVRLAGLLGDGNAARRSRRINTPRPLV
jgi:2-aminoadipate transaminase